MDTLKIKIVLAAAKYKSLARAAEEFSYTPSAFCHALAGFEESLGVKIFQRSSRGVTLTEEGEKLMPYFNAVIDAEKSLTDAAASYGEKHRKCLRIASYSSISRSLLTDVLKDFKRENPEIMLSVNVADDLSGWIEEDKADIVFADSRVLFNNEFYPIMEDKYRVIAPPGWFGERVSIGYSELYNYPYIDTCDVYADTGFDPEKFKERISFRSEDDLSVINTVRAGMGVTVLPELVLKENLSGVSVLDLEPKIVRTVGFAYKKHRLDMPVLSRFVRYIKKKFSGSVTPSCVG